MKRTNLISWLIFLSTTSFAQNVGIGTQSPNAKAALEISSTNKGVLFPRLTSAQRNAISSPPNGLHVFNTDERCLNYYDSLYQVWNCYCEGDTCKTATIYISEDTTAIDFYAGYASKYPGVRKFVILTREDVAINGTASAPAINFTTMPYPATIKIINNGGIYGIGGSGGSGASGQAASCVVPASNGTAGGNAILTKAGVVISVINYGLVAGGGGGGGGGGRTTEGQFGGGGGGGAGVLFGAGGPGGANTATVCPPFGGCHCATLGSNIAANGGTATNIAGGNGGNGASGGGNGGNGGFLAQTGQTGTGTGAGTGGAPGKAISGGSGNSVVGGQVYGIVD